MPHERDLPEDGVNEEEKGVLLTDEQLSRRNFPTVLAARRARKKGGPTFQQDVQATLDKIAEQGKQITLDQVLKRDEASSALPRPEVFRFATASDIELSAEGLARRLKGGDTPTESDMNAALVMIMDAEGQRRILFEQSSGVRTPDPITGISSLDDANALENLARRTGVGADVSKPSFGGNIRAFFNLP